MYTPPLSGILDIQLASSKDCHVCLDGHKLPVNKIVLEVGPDGMLLVNLLLYGANIIEPLTLRAKIIDDTSELLHD